MTYPDFCMVEFMVLMVRHHIRIISCVFFIRMHQIMNSCSKKISMLIPLMQRFCIINYLYVSYEYVSNGAFAGYPGFLSCVNT